MKNALLSSVALLALFNHAIAADLPNKKSVETTSAPIWTGLYAGVNTGAIWGNPSNAQAASYTLVSGAPNYSLIDAALLSGSTGALSGRLGFIGGGQIGYNYQLYQRFVVGGEADFQGIAGSNASANKWNTAQDGFTDYGGGTNSTFYVLSNQQVSTSQTWLGTVRGRVGYLLMQNLLVYGTGGLAYGGVNTTISNTQLFTKVAQGAGNPGGERGFTTGNSSTSSTLVGYSAGGGVEWMFLPNWSAKAEYLYYNLGNVSGTSTNIYYPTGQAVSMEPVKLFSTTNYQHNVSGNIIRAGVN